MLILLALILGVQGVTLWYVIPHTPPPPPPTTPNTESVEAALRAAIQHVGLDTALGMDADLMRTGKLGDILHHAAADLGRPIHTAQDLHDLLVK